MKHQKISTRIAHCVKQVSHFIKPRYSTLYILGFFGLFAIALISTFYSTRGTISASELAFIEHSVYGTSSGSVIPASCMANPHAVGDCQSPVTATLSLTPSSVAYGGNFTQLSLRTTNSAWVTTCILYSKAGNNPTWDNRGNVAANQDWFGAAQPLTADLAYMAICYDLWGYAAQSNVVSIAVVLPYPTGDSVTISSPVVYPNASTQYDIVAKGSQVVSGTNVTHEYVLINNTGANAGAYRGYIGWYYGPTAGWPGEIPCSGGGVGGRPSSGYGAEHINLLSCSTSVSGTQRTVTFRVSFNPSFTAPLTQNDLSLYVHAANQLNTTLGWCNGNGNSAVCDTNFAIANPAINSVTLDVTSVRANDTTPYRITITSSDIYGGVDIDSQNVYINLGGTNAGLTRGWFTWEKSTVSPGDIACTGGGRAVQQMNYTTWDGDFVDYGSDYSRLISCETSVAGNQRVNTFTVAFKPAFTTPLTQNDISGYLRTKLNHTAPWKNFDINFSLANGPATITATPGACGTQKIDVAWSAVAGATSYQLDDMSSTNIYSGLSTSFSHIGLINPLTSHGYAVRAKVGGSWSTATGISSVVYAPGPCVPPVPPVVTTMPVLSKTISSATLNSTIDPKGNNAFAWYRYGTGTPSFSCDNTRVNQLAAEVGIGSAPVGSWTQPLSGLTPNTSYFYCAFARSVEGGEGHGTWVLFNTDPCPGGTVWNGVNACVVASVQVNFTNP